MIFGLIFEKLALKNAKGRKKASLGILAPMMLSFSHFALLSADFSKLRPQIKVLVRGSFKERAKLYLDSL